MLLLVKLMVMVRTLEGQVTTAVGDTGGAGGADGGGGDKGWDGGGRGGKEVIPVDDDDDEDEDEARRFLRWCERCRRHGYLRKDNCANPRCARHLNI